jgi:hypothetical protein
MNLRALILPPGDTIDRIDLDKAASLIEAARACGSEAFDIAETSLRNGFLLPFHENDESAVRAFQFVSEAVVICEHSRDFQLMTLVNCLRYEPFDHSYLDLIYQEIIEFLAERDCEDQDSFKSRCLLSSVVRIEVAASTMRMSRADRKELHFLLAEARYTAEDVRIFADATDRNERLTSIYSSLKSVWRRLNGSTSVWE